MVLFMQGMDYMSRHAERDIGARPIIWSWNRWRIACALMSFLAPPAACRASPEWSF